LLIDGGVYDNGVTSTSAISPTTSFYSGVNTTAQDAQGSFDAGTDPATEGSGKPPADPLGSHDIVFTGSNASQVIFYYNTATGLVPPLYYTSGVPGQIEPANYGAIVLYAGVTPAIPPPEPPPYQALTPNVAVELTGGSNASAYDIRSTCGPLATTNAATNLGPMQRYVCALPPYGAVAGTTGSVTLVPATSTAAAIKSTYNVDTNIGNPRTSDPTGSFTPAAPKLYVELIYPYQTTAANVSTGNFLFVDYIYAEAGTK
jgi:hypothetical protein